MGCLCMQMCTHLHLFCYVSPLVYFVLFCFFLIIILFNYYFNAFLAFEKSETGQVCIWVGGERRWGDSYRRWGRGISM